MNWWTSARKFLKYALVVAAADTIPVLLTYLNNADGLSTVPWRACLDASGLVFFKALIGGGIGAALNVSKHVRPKAATP